MSVAIRSIAKGLPRVSMARIPVVAFVNSHPSAYSSSAWSESAKTTADKLEQSAKNLTNEADNKTAGLSQHASEAIRLVESHSVLKQDRAAIHAYRDGDHGEARFVKH
ncbi:hypothetical protein BGZ98_004664 [Dissophora globulifera]|uniref:Uncharacterized protein n=1 Tax=Dissophora globulifera TaxID=979702 RepID=A0A9P6R690_9FUNG|nr:hypothetical protein BGZ98_004664 [Dissophora globulifera]KAG0312116.1 hypothetical protein BGZ99_009711 [Dissophora globulifera]